MKKILNILAIFVLFLTLSNAYATDVVVVDIEKVVENSLAMKSVNKKLTSAKEKMQKELEKEESVLNAKRDDIASKSKILSKEALEEKMAEFQKDVLEFQKKVRERENNLKNAYMEAVVEITDEIKLVVEEVKAEGKYSFDIAITSPMTIYSDDSLDISAVVLGKLNKKLKSVEVNI